MKKFIDSLIEKIGVSGIFILFILIFYIITFFITPKIFITAINFSIETILKVLPIMALVFLLVFLSNIFINSSKIKKHFGEEAGVKGWLLSIIGGVISSGPVYMWYPLLADFKEKGMRNSFIIAFIYARAIKIQILPLMLFYFGFKFTIIFNILILVFSAINGFVVEKILNAKSIP